LIALRSLGGVRYAPSLPYPGRLASCSRSASRSLAVRTIWRMSSPNPRYRHSNASKSFSACASRCRCCTSGSCRGKMYMIPDLSLTDWLASSMLWPPDRSRPSKRAPALPDFVSLSARLVQGPSKSRRALVSNFVKRNKNPAVTTTAGHVHRGVKPEESAMSPLLLNQQTLAGTFGTALGCHKRS